MTLNCSRVFISYASTLNPNLIIRYTDAINRYLQHLVPNNLADPFAKQVQQSQFCTLILTNKDSVGVFLASSAVQQCNQLNQTKGIRAAMVHSKYIAQMCRKHNDANVCLISTDCIGQQLCGYLTESYLKSQFDHEQRNMMRVDKLTQLEDKYLKS